MNRFFQLGRLLTLALTALLSSGCSTFSDYDADNMMVVHDENSQASPHADSSMLFRKVMPRRAPSNNDFWFQHCEPTGEKTYYSKTVYECEFN